MIAVILQKLTPLLGYALPIWTHIKSGLRWLWKILWYPAALPVLIWLLIVGFGLKSCSMYNEVVREAIAYQDSIVKAQDTELWRLRADTLEANFEIRELYKRLDDREKDEVIYYQQLRRANDAGLQADLDSVFNRHVRGSVNQPGRQPAKSVGFTPIISGGSLAAPKFDPNTGWGKAGTVRAFSGR
ncbi:MULTISPECIES: hypothetical protein [unclassified Spirosoma]|uniref:hypothetical protein n=1 Tax=unclassified Spirosoma TaxID=2621999 RepID=UPI000966E986|nr:MULTISPECIES: hypothetical protein [unclassified Spirosoma]MBN8824434.1 hypothetical protein [Spirosoma sp.]OJW70103.1 MAG: hypothetical protein BGO59_25855 [Spirosoma sp. 48-14]